MSNTADLGGPAEVLVTAVRLRELVDSPAGRGGIDAGVCVVDARSRRRYLAGHIPGAVNLPLPSLVRLEGRTQVLIQSDEFAAQVGAVGIDESLHVIVYGERGGMDAAYVLWALEYYGHPRVSFLDGGLEAWERMGGDISTDVLAASEHSFSPQVRPDLRADFQDILPRLSDPEFQLIDTRTPQEFTGEMALTQQGGHIPGAIRLDWEQDLESDLSFKPPQQLAKELTEAGIDTAKESVLYCLSGPRAAHVYIAMKLVGCRHLRLYDRSWSEWGNREDLPVERGGSPSELEARQS